jgi:hypothetical protein
MAVTNEFQKRHKRVTFVERKSEYEIGTLDDAIEWLQAVKAKIPAEALEVYASLHIDTSYSYYDSIVKEYNARVYYWIPRTEEEIKEAKDHAAAISKGKREAAKKRKEEKERTDRIEYERLKAKFEASV